MTGLDAPLAVEDDLGVPPLLGRSLDLLRLERADVRDFGRLGLARLQHQDGFIQQGKTDTGTRFS